MAEIASVGRLIERSHFSGHAQSRNGCKAVKGNSPVLPPT
jgi:hypothetical protein